MLLGSSPFHPHESSSPYIDLCLRGNCFPQEIFLESHLVENFICPIDFAVCREPLIDSCGHTFGRVCIKNCLRKNNKCPLTNKQYGFLKKFATNFGVKNFLGSLRVKCLNHGLTCQWQGILDELEKHLAQDCVDIREDCPIEGCEEKISRGELLEHIENTCKFVKMRCLFESQGCQEMLNSKDFPFHLVNHHYEEIFQCVKKFDFLNKEKENYEKKYNDLLKAFFFVDTQKKKIIQDLKKENVILKNKIYSCITSKISNEKKQNLKENESLPFFDKKKVSSLKKSLESPQENENFDKILEGMLLFSKELKQKKNNSRLTKRSLAVTKQIPIKKKTKMEELCFTCNNI